MDQVLKELLERAMGITEWESHPSKGKLPNGTVINLDQGIGQSDKLFVLRVSNKEGHVKFSSREYPSFSEEFLSLAEHIVQCRLAETKSQDEKVLRLALQK